MTFFTCPRCQSIHYTQESAAKCCPPKANRRRFIICRDSPRPVETQIHSIEQKSAMHHLDQE